MTKDDRLDMRVRAETKAALMRLAAAANRSLANYVETVLQEHIASADKREAKRK